MENFDVVIIGGGPAGLQCAKILSESPLSVLLLEKEEGFGDKLCAGGLTLKYREVLCLPDTIIEHSISHAVIHSRRRRADTLVREPFLFTVNRKELGTWQRSLLEGTGVEVRTRTRVSGIDGDRVILQDGREITFRHLVGADGYASVVRRHLGLEVRRKLIAFQYTFPEQGVDPVLEVFLDARRFHRWYAWIFPHRDSLVVGCCCDPARVKHRKVVQAFREWVEEKGFDPGAARLESLPIACDYRGHSFGNIYLAGEAAGLASGFSGEGIYQALASGQEVARMILNPDHRGELLKQVILYNRKLDRVLGAFRLAGPLKGALQEFLVYLINRERFRDRINAHFS
jgi:geranylgeranyl reductase family protein